MSPLCPSSAQTTDRSPRTPTIPRRCACTPATTRLSPRSAQTSGRSTSERDVGGGGGASGGVDLPHQVPHKASRAVSNSRKRSVRNASTTSDAVSDDSPHKRNRRARHHAQGRAPLAEVAELAQTGQPTNNPWRKRDDEGRLHRALRRARENDRGASRLVSRDSSPEPDGEHEATRDDKPVIVMVGNKPVVPKGRDIAHAGANRSRVIARGDAVGRHPGCVELRQVRRRGEHGVHLSPVQRVYHLSPRTLRLTEDAKRRETFQPRARRLLYYRTTRRRTIFCVQPPPILSARGREGELWRALIP